MTVNRKRSIAIDSLVQRYFGNSTTYAVVMWTAACLYLALFVMLLCFPERFLEDAGVAGNESAFFLSRRAAMLMLGFSALSFQARKASHSVARQGILLSISVSMAGFAVLGSVEYWRGFANAGILKPVAVESALATTTFLLWLVGGREPE
jgi:hypothetical protein